MKLMTLCIRPRADPPKRFPLPSGQGLRQLEQERAGLQVARIYLPHVKIYPHRFKTPKDPDGQFSTYPTARQDNKKNLMKACHCLQVYSAIMGKHRHLSYPGVFLCDHGDFCPGTQEKATKLLTGNHMRCQSEQRLQQMGQERAVFSDPAVY